MEWWEGAAKLLSAGPLGLGAIIVVVTGFILMTGKAVEKGRLKLSLSMLGAGCLLVLAGFFVLVIQTNASNAASAAALALAKASIQHKIYFRIDPLDSDPDLPRPEIVINGKKLIEAAYTVDSDTTIIIDVGRALKNKAPTDAEKTIAGKKTREQLAADIETSVAQIQRITQLMAQSCPGGAHGTNPFHYDDVLSLTNSVSGALQNSKNIILNAPL